MNLAGKLNFFGRSFERIKNRARPRIQKEFRFSSLSFVIMLFFLALSGVLMVILFAPSNTFALVILVAPFLLLAVAGAILPFWNVLIVGLTTIWIALLSGLFEPCLPALAFVDYLFAGCGSLAIILAAATQLVNQWEQAVVLRFGKFHRVKKAGVFFLWPFIDRATSFIDTRIRATDFSAEKTLTNDTVPVHVDALAFWMIWDAQKAILEVENFTEAVILAAQTALRDSIGKHNLADLLAERETLGREIQQILDQKTNPWGVTVLSIEFTDILIPQSLEDAMSKQAQAERERQSRVILSQAEKEVAKAFVKAAGKYKNQPEALRLRAMNMVYDGIRNNSSLMLMPAAALDSMNIGDCLGPPRFLDRRKKQRLAENSRKIKNSLPIFIFKDIF